MKKKEKKSLELTLLTTSFVCYIECIREMLTSSLSRSVRCMSFFSRGSCKWAWIEMYFVVVVFFFILWNIRSMSNVSAREKEQDLRRHRLKQQQRRRWWRQRKQRNNINVFQQFKYFFFFGFRFAFTVQRAARYSIWLQACAFAIECCHICSVDRQTIVRTLAYVCACADERRRRQRRPEKQNKKKIKKIFLALNISTHQQSFEISFPNFSFLQAPSVLCVSGAMNASVYSGQQCCRSHRCVCDHCDERERACVCVGWYLVMCASLRLQQFQCMRTMNVWLVVCTIQRTSEERNRVETKQRENQEKQGIGRIVIRFLDVAHSEIRLSLVLEA